MQSPGKKNEQATLPGGTEPYPFEQLLVPAVEQADALVWSNIEPTVSANLTANARACLRGSLLAELSALCAPALYERFNKARAAGYGSFVEAMRAGGFRDLFEAKPVLLRLIAVLTRQWIDTFARIRRAAGRRPAGAAPGVFRIPPPTGRVDGIEGALSDPHNGGRSVLILRFEDGARLAYKPKDLRLDVAWQSLIGRLNRAGAPLDAAAPCMRSHATAMAGPNSSITAAAPIKAAANAFSAAPGRGSRSCTCSRRPTCIRRT